MPTIIKIIMLGKVGVGKTSILLKCTMGVFDDQKPTLGIDFSSYQFQHNAQEYILQIWDTAGQERYRSMTNTYYKNSNIVLLTVSAQDGIDKNLQDIRQLLKYYQQHASSQHVYVFVNKTDLISKMIVDTQWQKQEQLVKKIKKEYNIKQIYFVSAKNTPKEQFQGYIKHTCLNYLQNDYTMETAPSSFILSNLNLSKASLSPKKKKSSKKEEVSLKKSKSKKKEGCCN